MKHVVESSMYFGDYPDENYFAIENSVLHQSIGEGIKTVEFILLSRNNNVLFVEAKTSCPNAENKDENTTKQESFEKYYQEITEKFCDSFQMYLAAITGRNVIVDEFGEELLRTVEFSKRNFCFVLVIESARDSAWLAGPKEELGNRINKIRKIWGVKVIVLNHAMAVEYGLVKN